MPAHLNLNKKTRLGLLYAFGGALVTLFFKFDPILQNPEFFRFADQRNLFGIPNFLNAIAPFLIFFFGSYGLILTKKLKQNPIKFVDPYETIPHFIFYFGCILFALGSGYFHLTPNMETLFWARAGLALIFTSLFTIVFFERMDMRYGWNFMPFFLLAGVGSVVYWFFSGEGGFGDLRPFVLILNIPLVFIPIMMFWGPPRYTGKWYFAEMLGFYLLSRIFEVLDFQILDLTGGLISGNTLKYLAFAFSVFAFIRYVKNRKALPGTHDNRP